MARLTTILYKLQHQEHQILPTDPKEFVQLIESYDPQLCGFFDILYQSMNPQSKNNATQEKLKKKLLIYAIIWHLYETNKLLMLKLQLEC